MAVPIETNIAIRDRVRAAFAVPHPASFRTLSLDADLTEEQLAELEKLRLFNSRFLSAVRSGNPDAINELRPKPAARGPQGAGRFEHFAANLDVADSSRNRAFGPINYPYIIREITISAGNTGAAGTFSIFQVELFLLASNPFPDTVRPTVPRLWPETQAADDVSDGVLFLTVGDAHAVTYHPNKLVLDTGQFLDVFFDDPGTATIKAGITILIEQIDTGPGLYSGLFPSGRGLTPPPAKPRATGPVPPRAARVLVKQGARILAERTVPWPLLDGSIKAKWFLQQAPTFAASDPTVEWIL